MDNKSIWDKNWIKVAEYSTNSAGSRWAFYLIEKVLKDIDLGNGVILDVGCGMGNKSAFLADLYRECRVVGFDFSKEGVGFASEYYKDRSNLSFECGDISKGVTDRYPSVSLITSFEVIEHIEDWESFLTDLCNTSDRYILLSTPTGRMRNYEKSIGHYRNFQKGQLEAFMEKNGYKRVKILYAGFPFWSPITRDLFDLHAMFMNKEDQSKSELIATCNPLVHGITYFLYRYLSFDNFGDQFMGLFEKNIEKGSL